MTHIELESLKLFKHNTYKYTLTLSPEFQLEHNINVREEKTLKTLFEQLNAIRCCAAGTTNILVCPHCCLAKDTKGKNGNSLSDSDSYYVSIKNVEQKNQTLAQNSSNDLFPDAEANCDDNENDNDDSIVYLSSDLSTPTDCSPAQPHSPSSSTDSGDSTSPHAIKLTVVRKNGSSLPVVASSVSKSVVYGSNGSATFSGYVKPICSSSRNHLHCNVVLAASICNTVVFSSPFALQARRFQSTKLKKPDTMPAKRGRPHGSTNKTKRIKFDPVPDQDQKPQKQRKDELIPNVVKNSFSHCETTIVEAESIVHIPLNSFSIPLGYVSNMNDIHIFATPQQHEELSDVHSLDFDANDFQLFPFEDTQSTSADVSETVFPNDFNSDFNIFNDNDNDNAKDWYGIGTYDAIFDSSLLI